MNRDDSEREAIGRYKEYFDDHFGVVDNLQQLWLSPFDRAAYPDVDPIDALALYIEEAKTFAHHLRLAALYRQQHYEMYLMANGSEDAGHRHWREGLNRAGDHAARLLQQAEREFDAGFDQLAAAKPESTEELDDFVFKTKNPKPRTHNVAHIPKIKKPVLSKRQLLHRLQCAKRVKEFDDKRDHAILDVAIKEREEAYNAIIRARSELEKQICPLPDEIFNAFPELLSVDIDDTEDKDRWRQTLMQGFEAYLVMLYQHLPTDDQISQFCKLWGRTIPYITNYLHDNREDTVLKDKFHLFTDGLVRGGMFYVCMLGVHLIDVIRVIQVNKINYHVDSIYGFAIHCFAVVTTEKEIKLMIETVRTLSAAPDKWQISCYWCWAQSYFRHACACMDTLIHMDSKERVDRVRKIPFMARYLKDKDPRNMTLVGAECVRLRFGSKVLTPNLEHWVPIRAQYLEHLKSIGL